MKLKPMLGPMERPQYKPSLATRLIQDRAEKAEPKLSPLEARPKDGWVYGKPKS